MSLVVLKQYVVVERDFAKFALSLVRGAYSPRKNTPHMPDMGVEPCEGVVEAVASEALLQQYSVLEKSVFDTFNGFLVRLKWILKL
jgi:hypothetical protein